MARVAIIGAGIAGLALARGLEAEHEVTVYEKSRGPGGRMATRYAGAFEFDHGAQFFTARSEAFRNMLEPLVRDGLVAPWQARYAEISADGISLHSEWSDDEPRYVGVPRMNVIGKALAGDLEVRYRSAVTRLEPVASGWRLEVTDAEGANAATSADWVFVCVPLQQAATLLSAVPGFNAAVGSRSMQGCHALMLGFESLPELPFDAATVHDADIAWLAVNSSKPGRGAPPAVVVHATNAWSERTLELGADTVIDHMSAELRRVSGIDADAAVHKAVHRWRYANAPYHPGATHWLDVPSRLGVAGDWWTRGRVEYGFESARALLDEWRDCVGQ